MDSDSTHLRNRKNRHPQRYPTYSSSRLQIPLAAPDHGDVCKRRREEKFRMQEEREAEAVRAEARRRFIEGKTDLDLDSGDSVASFRSTAPRPRPSSPQPMPSMPSCMYRGLSYGAAADYDKSQFEVRKDKSIPWKSGILALFLLSLGIVLLVVCVKRMWESLDEFTDRIVPLVILGCMSIIPGAYHCWVFAGAFFQVPGYSYDDIPQFN